MPIKKLDFDGIHPANPIADVIEEINENLDAIVEAFNNVNGGVGVVGETGAKGDKGDRGELGPQGPQGLPGPKGDKGDPGTDGRHGVDGKDGIDGKDGLQGIQGLPGKDGTNGKDGIDGKNGVDGRDGKDGLPGPKGDKGETGAQGIEGPAGKDGKDGAQGLPGKDGKDGLPGAQGPAGVAGAQGIQGLPGKDGINGTNGKDGLPGAAGAQGIQGVAGAKGDTGAQGLGCKQTIILNSVAPDKDYYTGADVNPWSASYTGQGGQVLVRADITSWSQSSGVRNWYLKRNGTTVATGYFYFNAVNTHMTLPPIQYVDTTGAGANTWSIAVGTSLLADTQDRGTITVTETVGMSNTTITKAAAYVDAGTFVTLDNIKCTVTTTGNRGLSVAAVSGSFAAHVSATFGYISGVGGSATSAAGTYTTTPSGSFFGWSFPNQGDGSTYLISDVTNNRFYRVTLMIGPGYSKNFISIERLI